MKIDRIKIKRVATGEQAAAWARALQDPSWHAGAAVLKDEPRSSWVRRANMMGRDVVVKCRLLNTVGRRFKSAVGMGHGDKQWRGAELLTSKQIMTARPLARGAARVDGAHVELLVLEYLAGPTLLEVMDAVVRGARGVGGVGRVGPPVRTQHRIAIAVGRTIPQLIRAGVWNRDHKPSNLIVLDPDAAEIQIALIDCVGIRRYGFMGVDECEAESMAAALITEPIGCDCAPRRALWMRAVCAMYSSSARAASPVAAPEQLREIIDTISRMIPSKSAARPKVNPLV